MTDGLHPFSFIWQYGNMATAETVAWLGAAGHGSATV